MESRATDRNCRFRLPSVNSAYYRNFGEGPELTGPHVILPPGFQSEVIFDIFAGLHQVFAPLIAKGGTDAITAPWRLTRYGLGPLYPAEAIIQWIPVGRYPRQLPAGDCNPPPQAGPPSERRWGSPMHRPVRYQGIPESSARGAPVQPEVRKIRIGSKSWVHY
jgi:hypothetical protein